MVKLKGITERYKQDAGHYIFVAICSSYNVQIEKESWQQYFIDTRIYLQLYCL